MPLSTYNFRNSAMPRYNFGAIPPADQINASNLAYVRGGINTDPTAGVTTDLLNPDWGPAVYDTEKRGAEYAVGGGYQGSPLASYQTARMRAADIERRALEANQLLQGSYNRIPNPANQENLLAQQQQEREFQQRQALDQAKFDWEKQQQQQKNDYASGYRYQNGQGYTPLPQYMKSGAGDSYTLLPWGATQTGPTGIPERYRY